MIKREGDVVHIPRTLVGAFVFLWLIGVAQAPSWQTFLSPLVAVLFCQALWSGWWYWQKRRRIWFHPAVVVNGLLPALFLSPLHGVVPLAAASILTAFLVTRLSKQMAVLLPGVYGLIAISLFFGVPVVWRGDVFSTGAWIACLCVIPFLWREKRLGMSVWFIAAYFLFFLLLRGHMFALSQVLDESVMICSFLIVPLVWERKARQLLVKQESWALMVLAWFVLLYVVRFTWADLLLSSIVAAHMSMNIPKLYSVRKRLLQSIRRKMLSL